MSAVQHYFSNVSDQRPPARGLVSIVIPCYRGEKYLAAAIESCLNQTYHEIEVIVVDDASPDNCAAIAETFCQRDRRVRLVRHSNNGGVSRAFNSGFAVARGEYFTRLAQDDTFEPDAIAAMVAHLRVQQSAGLVYCDMLICDSTGKATAVHEAPPPESVLRTRNQIGLCVMWPRWTWDAVGGFDPEFDSAEDFEYWLRIAHRFPISRCPGTPKLRMRHHEGMGSVRQLISQNERSRRAIEKWLCGPSRGSRSVVRIALAYADYAAAIAYSERGMATESLILIARSFRHWPFALPATTEPIPFARAKFLTVSLLRLARLRRAPAIS